MGSRVIWSKGRWITGPCLVRARRWLGSTENRHEEHGEATFLNPADWDRAFLHVLPESTLRVEHDALEGLKALLAFGDIILNIDKSFGLDKKSGLLDATRKGGDVVTVGEAKFDDERSQNVERGNPGMSRVRQITEMA